MTWERIRPLVIGVARRDGTLFVAEGHDPAGEDFYRPVGGAIEFGESSEVALRREFAEELEVEIENPRYLGTIENRFEFDGEAGHEVVIVYEIDLPAGFAAEHPVTGHDDGGVTFEAGWVALETLRAGARPLYPEGLLDVLGNAVHVTGEGKRT
jgi:ADP-ribose pyrophosphatase YjhB (NUDIX family)